MHVIKNQILLLEQGQKSQPVTMILTKKRQKVNKNEWFYDMIMKN